MQLPRIVQPFLDQLSERIHQSSSVSILDETEIVYVARAAQRRVMSISFMPGSRLPAYRTSMGRVLLATLPDDDAFRLLEASQRTVTDIAALMVEIKATRERGYCSIDQEVELGLRSVAVPLQNSRGRIVAALNVGLAATAEGMEAVISRYIPPLLSARDELKAMLP